MKGIKTSDYKKNRRKVEFHPHEVATTPQDKSPRCRIWHYGER